MDGRTDERTEKGMRDKKNKEGEEKGGKELVNIMLS